ncbi:MAG: DUF2240 family protein [Archaeoglobaceae archaeon]
MLRNVIAAAFRSKGKKEVTGSELNYVLSFDLNWFTHEKSKQVVDTALKKGLLIEDDDKLKPSFDVNSIEVPLDFKPELKRVLSSSSLDEIIWDIAQTSGKEVSEITAMINQKQEELGNVLNMEVVALLIAKSYDVNPNKYIEDVWKETVENYG